MAEKGRLMTRRNGGRWTEDTQPSGAILMLLTQLAVGSELSIKSSPEITPRVTRSWKLVEAVDI